MFGLVSYQIHPLEIFLISRYPLFSCSHAAFCKRTKNAATLFIATLSHLKSQFQRQLSLCIFVNLLEVPPFVVLASSFVLSCHYKQTYCLKRQEVKSDDDVVDENLKIKCEALKKMRMMRKDPLPQTSCYSLVPGTLPI